MATAQDFDTLDLKRQEKNSLLTDFGKQRELKILYKKLVDELNQNTKTILECVQEIDAFE